MGGGSSLSRSSRYENAVFRPMPTFANYTRFLGHHNDSVRHILKREAQFRWESELFHLYTRIRGHCLERTLAGGREGYTGDAALCHIAGLPLVRGSCHCGLRLHYILRGAKIRQEEHAGLSERLQLDRWFKRGCNAGIGRSHSRTSQWRESVHAVVPICAARVRYWNFTDGDHLFERE